MVYKNTLNLFYGFLFITTFNCAIAQQVNNVQLYTFAHSLIDHRPPLIATPSDETTILHWIYDISQSSAKTFASTGQFGQLPNHVDNLPPNSNLGYDIVPNSWDETQTTFSNSNLNTIMLTVANFIQWLPPSDPDPTDAAGRSVIQNTESLFDWVNTQIPSLRYYIYANWPEMDLQNAYPPTIPSQAEINNFHDNTIGTVGGFAAWWTAYQDSLVASRPQLNTKLIPVGMIISKLLRDVLPNQIAFDELYEDAAPHGRANIYFLAGMITYMALYEENLPESYMPSSLISSVLRDSLETIRNFAWQELNNFNFPNGDSRVFYNEPILQTDDLSAKINISLTPNPVENTFKIQSDFILKNDLVIYDFTGKKVAEFSQVSSEKQINADSLASGVYYVRIKNSYGVYNLKLVKKE